jgi:tRNA A-37 threonylcarbamoyl transferase component Bud32
MPTSEGLVSLAERVDIKSFARKMLSSEEGASITVKPIGGMLNDIYLINAYVKGKEKKVLVKRFKDWSGFKWFPLTLWSHGARVFAVSAKARLAKEIATSEFLRCRGFNVPKILQVSNATRLVFMEYIEGEDLSQGIKRIALATGEGENQKDFAEIEKAGEIMAQVHSYNMTLGDTKPENMIITPNDTIYMLDFEQATMDGDKAWDIAEFLYYSGHYLQQLNGNVKAELIAQSFIRGYLKGGGNVDDVKKAGLPKYTRVFSVFTRPPIIVSIANLCKKTETPQVKN